MTPATSVDLYQLTSMVPHWDAGMADTPVAMSFFSRRLPKDSDGNPVRGYLLWTGLRRCLEWLQEARFDSDRIATLCDQPVLGPALRARPDLVTALREWKFRGWIDSPPEGTPIVAGRAVSVSGVPLDFQGVRPAAQTPFLVVRTDMLTAKLIETPLLSIINHMTMVASKAARVVDAAGDRAVLEFGQRRTHPQAAVDGAYAAWIAGCVGTSNVEAHHRYGVPVLGTMDHFAIQAWEQDGVPRHVTERAYFEAFYRAYPTGSVLLVDTYDTFGAEMGIRSAVAATEGKLSGVRLDSQITRENVCRARALLDELGAPQATIVVSGGMDEYSIRALGDAPVDAFGVGERIVTSPDAPVGVGAVGKLCLVDGRPTMKLSRGSGKATLPGLVQAYRQDGRDVIACRGESVEGRPLLEPVWIDNAPLPLPDPADVRAASLAARRALPEQADWGPSHTAQQVEVPVSPGLETLIRETVNRCLTT